MTKSHKDLIKQRQLDRKSLLVKKRNLQASVADQQMNLGLNQGTNRQKQSFYPVALKMR